MNENNDHSFNIKTIETIIKSSIKDKVKISDEANKLTSYFLELIVVECFNRMAKQAALDETDITLTHLEKIIPQLLLDFF